MATWTWTLQGSTPTTIDASDVLQFASGTFNSAITVGSYNTSMHVDQNGGGSVDDASGHTPKNNKFVSQTGGTGGDSQADWGDGTEDIDQILTSECALKINFSDTSSVATTNGKFFAYGADVDTNPTGVTFVAAEQGDTNFTAAETQSSAVSLNDDSAATSHDFYLIVSASPDSVGAKSFTLRAELTYS